MTTDYEKETSRIITSSSQDFRASDRSDFALRITIAKYLALGRLAGISQGELIDFLGVSSPSILEMAGYNEAEQDQVMTLLGQLSDDEITFQEKQLT